MIQLTASRHGCHRIYFGAACAALEMAAMEISKSWVEFQSRRWNSDTMWTRKKPNHAIANANNPPSFL